MEVVGEVTIAVWGTGVTKLHYRSETDETYVEVDGTILRETNPTINAYRAFVTGLVQSLTEERKRNKEILTKKD